MKRDWISLPPPDESMRFYSNDIFASRVIEVGGAPIASQTTHWWTPLNPLTRGLLEAEPNTFSCASCATLRYLGLLLFNFNHQPSALAIDG
jgi:hypothetical protein